MTFSDSIRTCFRKYATFSGRAVRSEYWWFVLFVFLGQLVLGFVDSALFGTTTTRTANSYSVETNSVLGSIFGLATLIPALAVGWRRMHDTGRSGIFLLYPLIAMVGIYAYIAFVVGLGTALGGDMLGGLGLLAQGAGFVAVVAVIVLIFSPLIVIWWLTRPTEPRENQWGPIPTGAAA